MALPGYVYPRRAMWLAVFGDVIMANSQNSAVQILVLGLASIVLSLFGVGCGPAFILGPVLGMMAVFGGIRHIKSSPEGKILALLGVASGAAGVLLGLLLVAALFLGSYL